MGRVARELHLRMGSDPSGKHFFLEDAPEKLDLELLRTWTAMVSHLLLEIYFAHIDIDTTIHVMPSCGSRQGYLLTYSYNPLIGIRLKLIG